jgi:hypothetical protein
MSDQTSTSDENNSGDQITGVELQGPDRSQEAGSGGIIKKKTASTAAPNDSTESSNDEDQDTQLITRSTKKPHSKAQSVNVTRQNSGSLLSSSQRNVTKIVAGVKEAARTTQSSLIDSTDNEEDSDVTSSSPASTKSGKSQEIQNVTIQTATAATGPAVAGAIQKSGVVVSMAPSDSAALSQTGPRASAESLSQLPGGAYGGGQAMESAGYSAASPLQQDGYGGSGSSSGAYGGGGFGGFSGGVAPFG